MTGYDAGASDIIMNFLKNNNLETMQNAPTLEAVLQQLRSGDSVSRTSTGPDYTRYLNDSSDIVNKDYQCLL